MLALEGHVADGHVHARARAQGRAFQARRAQRVAGGGHGKVVLNAHELPVLAHLQPGRGIAGRDQHMAGAGDDYRIAIGGLRSRVHSR